MEKSDAIVADMLTKLQEFVSAHFSQGADLSWELLRVAAYLIQLDVIRSMLWPVLTLATSILVYKFVTKKAFVKCASYDCDGWIALIVVSALTSVGAGIATLCGFIMFTFNPIYWGALLDYRVALVAKGLGYLK